MAQQQRPLASFSTMWFPSYHDDEKPIQQRSQQQQQPQGTVTQTTMTEKKKITIKRRVVTTRSQDQDQVHTPNLQEQQTFERKKITIKRRVVTTTSQDQGQEQDQVHQTPNPQEKQTTKKKITIKRRVVTTTTTTHSQEQQKQTLEKQKQKKENYYKTYVTDYAPPATGFYQPRSDYIVPPPTCSRFFIENKHCFLRRHDNTCIDPSTKKVIGFWNEQVGENCKLLPIEDETTYEEVNTAYQEVENVVPLPIKQPKQSKQAKQSKQSTLTKSRFVSDAQRARVASEPVALLREKLAFQYGITKQRN